MNKKDSFIRGLKREAMRKEGLTFRQRTMQAVASGKPIKQVKFEVENKQLVAKEA